MTAAKLPAYVGANRCKADRVRFLTGQPKPEIIRRAPNTGHRFIRYSRAILPSLLGLAFLVVLAGLAAGWLGAMR